MSERRPRRLKPMVDWIGNTPIEHGERGREMDPRHPDACLCGRYRDYLMCDGEGISGMTFKLADDGTVEVTP